MTLVSCWSYWHRWRVWRLRERGIRLSKLAEACFESARAHQLAAEYLGRPRPGGEGDPTVAQPP